MNDSPSRQLRSRCDGSCGSATGLLSRSVSRRQTLHYHNQGGREESPVFNHVDHHHHENRVNTQTSELLMNNGLRPHITKIDEDHIASHTTKTIIESQQTIVAEHRIDSFNILSASSESSATMNNRAKEKSYSDESLSWKKAVAVNRWNSEHNSEAALKSRSYGLDSDSEEEAEHHVHRQLTVYQSESKRLFSSALILQQIQNVLYISTISVWRSLYKFALYVFLLDVWMLSRCVSAVRRFLHEHKQSLLLALLFILLSGLLWDSLPVAGEVSLAQKVSELSSDVAATASYLSNSVMAAFFAFFASSTAHRTIETRQQQQSAQFGWNEEQLRDAMRVLLKEEIAAISLKLSSNTADTKDVNRESESVNSLREALLMLENEVKMLKDKTGKMWSRMDDLSFNISDQSDWLKQWLTTTLMEMLLNSESQDEQLILNMIGKLKRSFVSREEFLNLVSTTIELKQSFESRVEKTSSAAVGVAEAELLRIVRRELALYDADRIGLPDYALESAGGSVINTRCSETYTKHSSQIFLFGIPLWHIISTPRTVIQPGRQPGECWPFVGSEGYIVIQLSRTIRPTGFSLEHIPRSISPTGTIEAAPKDFSVWGLENEMDHGLELGKYMYDQDGASVQTFEVMTPKVSVYSMIELRIHSNHGHPEFTCVYRFRVHGIPV